jgi:hypothetical protein
LGARAFRIRWIDFHGSTLHRASNQHEGDCRFWYVIVYDGNGRPAACACLTAMTIDLADLADPRLAWIIRRMPQLLSRFRKLKLFICGLPGVAW